MGLSAPAEKEFLQSGAFDKANFKSWVKNTDASCYFYYHTDL